MAKRTLGGVNTVPTNSFKENQDESSKNILEESSFTKDKTELEMKLIDIIQNSGSLEKELNNIKNILKSEIVLAFNQGCINGNGAAREQYKGEVINIQDYLRLKDL